MLIMIVYPNAKINVGLRVVGKRPDGYHDLETIFYPIPGLHDVLEVEPADALVLEQHGIVVDCPPEQNLIMRCYQLVRERFPKQVTPVHIRFTKQIPFGAGLGGGSADAAFMVRALNDLFSLGMSIEEMEALVGTLGADCAFFVQNRPQMAEGIGNIFSPTDLDLSGLWIALVKPETAVSTREAYAGLHIDAQAPRLKGVSGVSQTKWQQVYVNDFEKTIFPLHPEIAAIKEQLLSTGAVYASMSGSGATVFGLFAERPQVDFPNCFVHIEQL